MAGSADASTIARNLSALRAEIAASAHDAGRAADAATLVAISKTHPAAAVEAALAAGQREFGENRVQEAQAKYPELKVRFPDLRLHLVGPVQSNKARDAVRLFDVIHSLDRPKLAEALAAAGAKEGRLPALLIQVNTGREPQKAGIFPDQADAFIAACRDRWSLAPQGLMCIPPVDEDPAPHFDLLAQIAARNDLKQLSMGMSGDFVAAIKHGATMVRVGTAIFGVREKPVA